MSALACASRSPPCRRHSFSRACLYSSPVRLRGGALRRPVAVEHKFINSQTDIRSTPLLACATHDRY
ncbi:hypothetical protein EYF80_027685 [Liparis tanakae]|uniref:Uncharacterized protein n=1 Tax=Liparis tanakae TaxID=230148 RepID=A0A4Z2HAQ4_9TELE|nr:hypothetical protein EYF80_027685 [Liparis tanakae]